MHNIISAPFYVILDAESERGEMIGDVIDVFNIIDGPPSVLWLKTGESFLNLVRLLKHRVEHPLLEQQGKPRVEHPLLEQQGKPRVEHPLLEQQGIPQVRRLQVKHEILLTLIWIRHYGTYASLSTEFGICLHSVREIIHHVIMVFTEVLVPCGIYWHILDTWDHFLVTNHYFLQDFITQFIKLIIDKCELLHFNTIQYIMI